MPIPTNKDIAEVTYNGVTIPLAESGGGESVQEIFDVTYGATLFEDIDAAYQAGKVCRLIRSGEIYFLTKFSTNSVMFWHIGTGGVRKFVACSSDNVWQSANANVQTTSSKVTEITDTSTDAQYPSAKAVYDLVQSQLLNITLGIDSITGLRSEFVNFAEAFDGINGVINSKISCTDAQVASYGYLKLSDLPVWDGSVV